MKLATLFTVGLAALSIAGFTNPTQAAGQTSATSIEVKKSTDLETETGKAPETTAKTAPAAQDSSSDNAPQLTLVAGSEVSLSAVIEADWVQGEPPKSFEPGKIYIFECWSTLCGPCIEMIPHVNELHKKYYDKGLRIHGMSVYENDKTEVVKFVKEKGDGMSYPVAFTGKNGPFELEWMKPAGAKGIPHAFIVRNGKLLESTLASRLTEELIETMLSGDKGAKQAAATIAAAKAHAAKIANLLQNIKSARRKNDTETMTANIQKLKVVEPDHPEIHTEQLWVLMINKQWPTAITTLNEMPASWAKDSFVSMNGMRAAMRNNNAYPKDFKKALIHSYSDYVFASEYIGPNHFACLSILQWNIGEKENATATANKMLDITDNFSNGIASYKTPYARFTKSVNEGTMPKFSDLSKWRREARNAPAPKPESTPKTPETALRAFFKAMALKDLAAIKKQCVANPDLSILTKGDKLTKPQLKMMMAMAEEGPIESLEVGDSFRLPASGKQMAVDKTMVNDDRKLLTMPGNPAPFPIVKVDNSWRVDASSIIAVRKAVAKLREKMDSQ